jgi:hypothetical protein
MEVSKIFRKCYSEIGGVENKDVKQYLKKRPKRITRNKFFEEVVWAVWVGGKSRKAGETFLKRAEKNGFDWDFATLGSWDKRHFRQFIEKLHGCPVPKQAYKRWQTIYDIARELAIYSNEKVFRKSFFDGKADSADLSKKDVEKLENRGFPFIGRANSEFILRNIGGEFIKCDRWLEEFLTHYKMSKDELEMRVKDLDIPLVYCLKNNFTIGVIPGLARNPIFEAGFPPGQGPYGPAARFRGNDGLRITVKYC